MQELSRANGKPELATGNAKNIQRYCTLKKYDITAMSRVILHRKTFNKQRGKFARQTKVTYLA